MPDATRTQDLRDLRPDTVAVNDNGVRTHRKLRRGANDLTGPHVEPGSVQRALHNEPAEATLAQRSADVRASVVDTVYPSAHPEQRIRTGVCGDTPRPSLGDVRRGSEVDAHEGADAIWPLEV